MRDRPGTPQLIPSEQLREQAERCWELAMRTSDPFVREELLALCEQLHEEAESLPSITET
jgi:hypothetical protein